MTRRNRQPLSAKAAEGSSGKQSFLARNSHSRPAFGTVVWKLLGCPCPFLFIMPAGLQSPSEMEGTSYSGGDGGIRGVWETTPLSLNLLQKLTLEEVAGSGMDACQVP